MLKKILSEKFEIDINEDKRNLKPHRYSDRIAEKLKGYVRLEESHCNYDIDATSRFDVPSLSGGKIYVREVRDEDFLINYEGFRPKGVNILLGYLENADQEDLAVIKLAIKNSLKEE